MVPSAHDPGTDSVNLVRHQAQCSICSSVHRDEIEARFIAWVPAHEIVNEFTNISIHSLYRHARAFHLFEKRRENAIQGVEAIAETSKSDSVRLAALREILKYNLKNHEAQKPSTDSAESTKKEKPEELGREASASTGSKLETPVDLANLDVVGNKGYGDMKAATNSPSSSGDSSADSASTQAPAAAPQTATTCNETTIQTGGRGAADEPAEPLNSNDEGHATSVSGSTGDGGVSAPPASTTSTETGSTAADGSNDVHEERESPGSDTKVGCESAPCLDTAQAESIAPTTDSCTTGGTTV